ncbi:single-minded homolog 2-like, partial [Psammomys obesus]|uniref:single-minded homolog 2-like n=1 Tax=Psammomys obesus TaxID=48139 RepID=UPI002452DA77
RLTPPGSHPQDHTPGSHPRITPQDHTPGSHPRLSPPGSRAGRSTGPQGPCATALTALACALSTCPCCGVVRRASGNCRPGLGKHIRSLHSGTLGQHPGAAGGPCQDRGPWQPAPGCSAGSSTHSLGLTRLLVPSRDVEYKELQLSVDQVSTCKSQDSWRTPVSTSHETRKPAKPKSSKMKTKLRISPYPTQQYGSFQMDRLECGQVGTWRGSPPPSSGPPEQHLHADGGDLLYGPPYGLPFSYHYGHFPLDPPVFSSKKPGLPTKFGQPQGPPCEVARFFLSTLPASSECQWRYANPLVPSSPSPAKSLSEPLVSAGRHGHVPNYEAPRFGDDPAAPSFPSCGHYREEPAPGPARAARQAPRDTARPLPRGPPECCAPP